MALVSMQTSTVMEVDSRVSSLASSLVYDSIRPVMHNKVRYIVFPNRRRRVYPSSDSADGTQNGNHKHHQHRASHLLPARNNSRMCVPAPPRRDCYVSTATRWRNWKAEEFHEV
jgi:hypothetical protein